MIDTDLNSKILEAKIQLTLIQRSVLIANKINYPEGEELLELLNKYRRRFERKVSILKGEISCSNCVFLMHKSKNHTICIEYCEDYSHWSLCNKKNI